MKIIVMLKTMLNFNTLRTSQKDGVFHKGEPRSYFE